MADIEQLSPRAQAKRQQILSAAQNLFLREGFSATSMDLVTVEAGVSKQTVYSYFSSKEKLFSEVLKNLVNLQDLEPIISQLEAAPIDTRDDLQKRLTEVAAKLTEKLMDETYLAVVRAAIAELPRFPQLGELFKEAVPYRVLRTITFVLKRAHDKGIAHVPNPELAARLYVGPLIIRVLLDGLLVIKSQRDTSAYNNHEELVQTFMRAIS